MWPRTSSDETVNDSKILHTGESSPSTNVCRWVNLLALEKNALKAFALALSSVKKLPSEDEIGGRDIFVVLKNMILLV